MELFLTTFDMVMPMFAIVLVGYIIRLKGLIPTSVAMQLNNFCFRVLIPCLLFKSALNVTFDIEYLWLFLFFAFSVAVSVPVLCVIAKRFIPDGRQAGAFVQTCFRTNVGIIGIGMMESACGSENIAPMVIIVATSTFLFNVAGITEMTYFSGSEAGNSLSFKKLVTELIKSPMVISAFAGLLVAVSGIQIPAIVMKPISDFSACCMPVAMLTIGMRLDFGSITGNRKIIGMATLIKMVIMPLVWTLIAYAVGFRGYTLCAVFFEKSSTTISIAPAIAEAYGCDGKITGEILITQTAVACVTIFIGVYLLQYFRVF